MIAPTSRVVSALALMLRFDGERLSQALGNLYATNGTLFFTTGTAFMEGDRLRELVLKSVAEMRDVCRDAGLAGAKRQAGRILKQEKLLDSHALNTLCTDLCRAVVEELGSQQFFQLLPQEIPYYEGKYFEKALAVRFPDAKYDSLEAGRCFALGRYTATAFHLMRVLEVGLRAFYKFEGATVPTNPSWGATVAALKNADADPDLIARIETIKDAWRNPTMHVEQRYGQLEADELLAGTRAFMRHLMTKI